MAKLARKRQPGAGAAAKAAGLLSLKHMAQISGKSESTLKDWHTNDRQAFEVMLVGCVTIYNLNKLKNVGVINVWT